MAGSFSSINIATSGLRYNQVALDIAANNLSNAATDGYVRRRLIGASVGGPEVPALWSRYDGHGDGVRVASAQRMTDPLLDSRVRREHGFLSFLQTSLTVLQRIEGGIAEPGPDGVGAALLSFRQGWQDLANNPGGDAARQQVLSRGATLAEALRAQINNVAGEEGDQRLHALDAVSQINDAAADIAQLNQTIMNMELNGTDVATLRDQRDQLVLGLAELTGAVTTVRPDGMFDVSVNGVALVSGLNAGVLTIASGITPTGASDGSPITYEISGVPVPAGRLGGELGAITELLSTTLPAYRAGLGQVAQDLADQINAQHALGFGTNGATGLAFFSYDPADPAGTIAVAITDPADLAAASVTGTLDGSNADLLSSAGNVDGDYQRLVNSFGSDIAGLQRRTANQEALTASIDGAWEQQAGVNIDEETISMMTAQRAYEASARLLTVIDEVLDTLINRTGLVGR